MTLTQERLLEVLNYNTETGQFTWRKATTRSIKAGAPAGTLTHYGYVQIKLDRHFYAAHRLAFLYMIGRFPVEQVDHINCCKDDNRWANLRECSGRVNQENRRAALKTNRAGLLGVTSLPGRHIARIVVRGKQLWLGSYPTADMAHAAYLRAKRESHEGCTL